MSRKLCLGLCIGLLASFYISTAKADCLDYEPASVTLLGVIYNQVDFGPPGYGEDPGNDSKEIHAYLKLDQPICTNPKTGNDAEAGEDSLVTLEMAYPFQAPFQKKWLNNHVSVSGTLFHAWSGHHHTKVLIAPTETHILSSDTSQKENK